jgi:WD40 repeat protein
MLTRLPGRLAFLLLLFGISTAVADPPPMLKDLHGDPLPPGAIARFGTVQPEDRPLLTLVFRATLSSEGNTLVSYGNDEMLNVWDVGTSKLRRQQPVPRHHFALGGPHPAPDGKSFAYPDATGCLCLWELESGAKRKTFTPPPFDAEPAAALLGRLSPLRGVAPLESAVGLGELIDRPEKTLDILHFSQDGKNVLTRQSTGLLRWWDVATGKPLARFPGPRGSLAFDFFNDVRRYASLREKELHQYDLSVSDTRHGKVLWQVSTPWAFGTMRFDPQGWNLAVRCLIGDQPKSSCELCRILEVHTGKVRRILKGPRERIDNLMYSPDGGLIVSVSAESDFRLWDVATGKQIHAWNPHGSGARCLGFSRDGTRLISVGDDVTILLWDVAELTKGRKPAPAPKLAAAELEQLWAVLGEDDAARAFDAICTLALLPAKTMPLLEQRLKPMPPVTDHQMQQWVRDLGSSAYQVRVKATTALADQAEMAKPALRAALTPALALEERLRVELLLAKIEQHPLTSAHLRGLRALEILEKIGTPEARRVMETLAGGAPEARLTQEAAMALRRAHGNSSPAGVPDPRER